MHKIKQGANDMKQALLKGEISTMAQLLKTAWENKKKQSVYITSPIIDEAMSVAQTAGAMAGKVSGAGGGGFIMFIVSPIEKKMVEKALSKLRGFVVPFSFTDGGAHGWRIYSSNDMKQF